MLPIGDGAEVARRHVVDREEGELTTEPSFAVDAARRGAGNDARALSSHRVSGHANLPRGGQKLRS